MVDQIAMRTRVLGDRTATAIGIGDVRLATSAARGVDASELERCLHEAVELGITLIETSEHADDQRLVGDVVRTRRARDAVLVATPLTVLPERPGAPNRDVLPERLPPAYVQERVEAALRASRLEVLPLVCLPLHVAWHASRAWAELAGTCGKLVREGKVLAFGAILDHIATEPAPVADDPHAWARGTDTPAPAPSLQPTAPTLALLGEPWLAAISVPYSLCERAAEHVRAAKPDLPLLARRPLAGGTLAGQLGPGVKLRPLDDRRAIDAATLERIAIAIARLARFVKHEPPAARSCEAARIIVEGIKRDAVCATIAELALRYVIDRGAIALVRLHRREHIPEALAAGAAPPLPRDLLDALPRDI